MLNKTTSVNNKDLGSSDQAFENGSSSDHGPELSGHGNESQEQIQSTGEEKVEPSVGPPSKKVRLDKENTTSRLDAEQTTADSNKYMGSSDLAFENGSSSDDRTELSGQRNESQEQSQSTDGEKVEPFVGPPSKKIRLIAHDHKDKPLAMVAGQSRQPSVPGVELPSVSSLQPQAAPSVIPANHQSLQASSSPPPTSPQPVPPPDVSPQSPVGLRPGQTVLPSTARPLMSISVQPRSQMAPAVHSRDTPWLQGPRPARVGFGPNHPPHHDMVSHPVPTSQQFPPVHRPLLPPRLWLQRRMKMGRRPTVPPGGRWCAPHPAYVPQWGPPHEAGDWSYTASQEPGIGCEPSDPGYYSELACEPSDPGYYAEHPAYVPQWGPPHEAGDWSYTAPQEPGIDCEPSDSGYYAEPASSDHESASPAHADWQQRYLEWYHTYYGYPAEQAPYASSATNSTVTMMQWQQQYSERCYTYYGYSALRATNASSASNNAIAMTDWQQQYSEWYYKYYGYPAARLAITSSTTNNAVATTEWQRRYSEWYYAQYGAQVPNASSAANSRVTQTTKAPFTEKRMLKSTTGTASAPNVTSATNSTIISTAVMTKASFAENHVSKISGASAVPLPAKKAVVEPGTAAAIRKFAAKAASNASNIRRERGVSSTKPAQSTTVPSSASVSSTSVTLSMGEFFCSRCY